MKNCHKCNGLGYYMYDSNHSKICEYCCKHDQGWWELSECHAGYIEGSDNRCCKIGCGMIFRDLNNLIKE